MSRIRLNSEYRNKGAVRFREHLEQENTQEKEAYLQAREEIIPLQKDTWKLAEKIVRQHYTDEDVKMAYHLQNKFDNVSTIAKDSCFHFGYKSNNKEDEDYDKDNETVTKHFDFRLNGNINGYESGKQSDFAYAMFRDLHYSPHLLYFQICNQNENNCLSQSLKHYQTCFEDDKPF